MTYLETFLIGTHTFQIDEDFNVWKGGCRIAQRDSLPEARATLHTYARCQLLAEVGSYSRIVSDAERALEMLGTDPFYLGKFLK